MPDDSSIHVFWVKPMPGVRETQRVVVVTDSQNQVSVVILLPDNSQVIITADRAVYVRDGQMLTLSQWQFAPVAAEYEVTEEPPEVPSRTGTFTLGGRRTYGG